MANVPTRALTVLVLGAVSVALPACQPPGDAGGNFIAAPPARSRLVAGDDVVVPPGYRIEAVARGLTYPTGVAFDDQGRPHVTEAGYSPGEDWTTPRLLRIEADGTRTVVAEGDDGPWNGAVWHDGAFYVAEGGHLHGGSILRIATDGTITPLVMNLPSFGDYQTTGPAVGPDGYIYFGQGTATNAGVVGEDNADLGWLKRFPAVHDAPCRDVVLNGHNFTTRDPRNPGRTVTTGAFSPYGIPTRHGQRVPGRIPCGGAIFRIAPEGGLPELVAWGLRNPYGMAFSPDGRLFATDTGYDLRGSRPVAASEGLLWHITADGWYGWPDFHGNRKLVDISAADSAERPQPLLALAPARPPSPVAVLAAGAEGFDISSNPAFGLDGKAVVAQGATGGGKVVTVDVATGAVKDFAVNRGGNRGPAIWLRDVGLSRPIAVRFDPTGTTLYVVDFGTATINGGHLTSRRETGVLWRITHSSGFVQK